MRGLGQDSPKLRALRALTAAILLIALVAGIPVALFAMGADPRMLIPDRWPALSEVGHWPDQAWQSLRFAYQDGSLARTGMLIILWGTWLLLAWMIVAEIVIQLRRGAIAARRFAPSSPRRWIAGVVAAALVLISSSTATAFPTVGPRTVATVQYTPPGPGTDLLATNPTVQAKHLAAPANDHSAVEPGPSAAAPNPWSVDPSAYPGLPRYTVVHGDTMWDLAHTHLGDGRRYTEIAELNRDRIPDPHWLQPGWVLVLPTDAINLAGAPDDLGPYTRQVVVQPGDTLSTIALREYGDPNGWPKLFDANHNRPQPDGRVLRNPDLLLPGWVLHIPTDTPITPAPPHVDPEPPETAQPPPTEPSPPPTATTPPNVPASPTTSPPASTAPGQQDKAEHDHSDSGSTSPTWIELPSGAIVGLTLAALITAAATILRLRRRHRRRLTGTLHARTPAPQIPPVVARLERAVVTSTSNSDQEVPVRQWEWPPSPPILTAHTDGGGERTLDLTTVAGLGLDGAGAHAAARAAVAAFLAADTLHRAEMLVAGDTAATVLDHPRAVSRRVDAPGLVWIDDTADALGVLETELARRTRLLADHELHQELHADTDTRADPATGQAASFDTYRDTDPAESLPTYVVLAAPPAGAVSRLHAVLELGRSYGIVGLLLGDWPTRLAVAEDGSVSAAQGDHLGQFVGTRLETLGAAEGSDILEVLTAARGAPEPTVQDPDPSEQSGQIPAPDSDDTDNGHAEPEESRPPAPVQLRLFGPVTVSTRAGEITTGLRSLGRELLAYLAVHPEGVSTETLEDQLLPDAPLGSGRAQIHTAVSHTRTALRKATGRRGTQFIVATAGRYRLDPQMVAVDVRELDNAITTARTTPDEFDRVQALTTVVELCRTGTPLDGARYAWVEEVRESIRQQALDALSHYATLIRGNDSDRAIDALSVAIDLDPYTEQLYQHLIQLQVDTDRPEAALATYRLLRARLADIDADPDPETERLLPVVHRNQH